MKIPSQLARLSRLFPPEYPLYLVGGAVRDGLLGIDNSDYDVASALMVEEVKDILHDSGYHIAGEYPRTGTLIIANGNFKCEYTAFRTDSYPLGRGDHAPEQVTFTRDIHLDATRRDFSCNAIYYDIKNNRYIDPTDGIPALEQRLLTTTCAPEKVLQEDALRIMRMARLSCELAFHIHPDTMRASSYFAENILDIARERITCEYQKILGCRRKYVDYEGFLPSYGLSVLNELNINKLILGDNLSILTLQTIDNLPAKGYYSYSESTQLAVIAMDLGDTQRLTMALKLSYSSISCLSRIVEGYIALDNLDDDSSYAQLKLNCCAHHGVLKDVIAIRMARQLPVAHLCDTLHIINNLHLPTAITALNVNGQDIMRRGISGKAVGLLLQQLLSMAIITEQTTREQQLELLDLLIAQQ